MTPKPRSSRKIKTFVLDTNILLHEPSAVTNFSHHDVVIPITVLEELDKFKRNQDDVGHASREVTRQLDAIFPTKAALDAGYAKPQGGTVRISMEVEPTSANLIEDTADHRILGCALAIQKMAKNKGSVILVTKDVNLRVKARALGMRASDLKKDREITEAVVEKNESKTIKVEDEGIDCFYRDGGIQLNTPPADYSFILLEDTKGRTAPAKHLKDGFCRKLLSPNTNIREGRNIKPRNLEQQYLMDALADPEVSVVTVFGRAGTGKTLLAIASGLSQIQDHKFDKLLISRAIIPMGKDIGFLPGPQPLDAKVLTPTGWRQMGDLKVGDKVIACNGKPSKILKIFPKGKKPVFNIATKEGKKTQACGEHPWKVRTSEDLKRNKQGRIATTQEIADNLYKNGKPEFSLPRNGQVEFTSKTKLPIPPYTMGCLLGDGGFGKCNISQYNQDQQLLDRVKHELNSIQCKLTYAGGVQYDIGMVTNCNKRKKPVKITNSKSKEVTIYSGVLEASKDLGLNKTTINSRCLRGTIKEGLKFEFLEVTKLSEHPVKDAIIALGLQNHKAPRKFIPDMYKFASKEARVELLRGLLDTDGAIRKSNGEVSFSTTSLQLARDLLEVVRSLGGKGNIGDGRQPRNSTIEGRKVTGKHKTYEFTIALPGINPFYIERKAQWYSKQSAKWQQHDKIISITPAGKKEVQCILIDNPEHLYITDDYIVTHNTEEQKMRPWVQPCYDALEYIYSKDKGAQFKDKPQRKDQKHTGQAQGKPGKPANDGPMKPHERLKEKGQLEIEVLAHIRGRSIPNAFFVVDELQNATKHEIKTIVTRMSEGSKIILIGDPDQIDNPYLDRYSNGLVYAVTKLSGEKCHSHVQLVQGERSELAELAAKKL